MEPDEIPQNFIDRIKQNLEKVKQVTDAMDVAVKELTDYKKKIKYCQQIIDCTNFEIDEIRSKYLTKEDNKEVSDVINSFEVLNEKKY